MPEISRTWSQLPMILRSSKSWNETHQRSELAQSTLKYARAKERYFVELRKSVPMLIDMATGKAPKTRDVDRIREIFSGYGEAQGKQLEAATVSMLKQLDGDAEVSKAEIEFYRVQRVVDRRRRFVPFSADPDPRL
jgi:hypothetical protein